MMSSRNSIYNHAESCFFEMMEHDVAFEHTDLSWILAQRAYRHEPLFLQECRHGHIVDQNLIHVHAACIPFVIVTTVSSLTLLLRGRRVHIMQVSAK